MWFLQRHIKTLTKNNISTDRFETSVCCELLDIMVDFQALTLCCFWLVAVENKNFARLLEKLDFKAAMRWRHVQTRRNVTIVACSSLGVCMRLGEHTVQTLLQDRSLLPSITILTIFLWHSGYGVLGSFLICIFSEALCRKWDWTFFDLTGWHMCCFVTGAFYKLLCHSEFIYTLLWLMPAPAASCTFAAFGLSWKCTSMS